LLGRKPTNCKNPSVREQFGHRHSAVLHSQATAANPPHEWAANKEEAMEEEDAIKPSKTEAKK